MFRTRQETTSWWLLVCASLLVICLHLAATSTIPHQHSIVVESEEFLRNPHYHSEEELDRLYADLMKQHPDKVEVLSAGKSVEGRELYVLHLNTNIRKRGLLIPMVKYVANMHGDETIGREMLIYLAEYLLDNYGKVDEVTRILNSTDLYLMPSMNPDGYARSVASTVHLLLVASAAVTHDFHVWVDINRYRVGY